MSGSIFANTETDMYQKNRFLKGILLFISVFLETTDMVTSKGEHEVRSDCCGLRTEWEVRKEHQ